MRAGLKYLMMMFLVFGLSGLLIQVHSQADSLRGDSIRIPFYHTGLDRVTAPVTVIGGKGLTSVPTADLKEALTGRIPNGEFTTVSSRPGTERTRLSIRGLSGLVLVDGIPRPLGEISPFEIESLNVLRGLSATAMFGPDARNGIVYVRTRRGIPGTKSTEIDLEYGAGIVKRRYLPVWLSSFDYATLYNEASMNEGLQPPYDENDLAYYRDGGAPLRYPDEDLYGQVFNNTMAFRRMNISHGGGNRSLRYFLNMFYTGEGNGLYKINDLSSDKVGLRSNLDVDVADFLLFTAGVYGKYDQIKSPNAEDQIWEPLSLYPPNAYPVRISADIFGISENFDHNPVGDLTNYLSTKRYDLTGRFNVGLELDMSGWIPGLSAGTDLAYDINTQNALRERPGLTYALYEPVFYDDHIVPDSLIKYGFDDPSAGLARVLSDYRTQFYNHVQVRYETRLGRHHLQAGLVNKFSSQRSFWKDNRSQDIRKQDLSLSVFYTYDNRYALDLTGVYSGLMNLRPENRFAFFPAAGISWLLSEESFLEESSRINLLKIRASYGSMGFYNMEDAFLYRTFWSEGSWTVFNNRSESSRQNYRGTYLIQLGNEHIDRAVQKEFTAGMDGEFFKDRLYLGIDYYRILMEGIVLSAPVPAVVGTGSYYENIGIERYWGYDLSVKYNGSIRDDLIYTLGMQAGCNESEVVVSNDIDYPFEWMGREGYPTDAIFGLLSGGLLTEDDLSGNYTQTFGEALPGNIKYRDLNGDGVIQSEVDEKMIGQSRPRYNFAVSLDLRYRDFSFHILGYGQEGYDINIRNNPYYYAYGRHKYSDYVMKNHWVQDDPDPGASHPRLTTGNSSNDNRNSTYWLIDGGFFSIKNVEVKYEFTRLSVFIRANNLFTFSGIRDLDPVNLDFGVSTYPSMRTLTIGMKTIF